MSGSKKIAKNSMFLYIRMFLIMGVTLYTSRVVLNTLGAEDYGIYGVVAGVISMFIFLNTSMAAATQRFLAYDIGRGDEVQLRKTFNATVNIHILIAVISFILAETIGLWFVNTHLNISEDRMYAVNWVYQFSIFTFILRILQTPYNALIIARERMSVFAYISVIDVMLNLVIVYLLTLFQYDKLILYSFLVLSVALTVIIIYQIYCRVYFKESRYQFYFDKTYYKTLASYSGWSLFGNLAAVARGQGNNIILNIFFGSLINAAYGISMQVQSALMMFAQNFQMAANPQIIKSYAAGEKERSVKLMNQSSRFSYFLLFLIAYPVFMNTEYILSLWLKEVPEHTVLFVQLVIIGVLISALSLSFNTGIQATGKIKIYQAVIGTLIFLNLPISYLLLKAGGEAKVVFFVKIIIETIALILRVFFIKKLIGFDVIFFMKNTLSRVVVITLLTVSFGLFIKMVLSGNISLSFLKVFVESAIYCSFIILLIIFLGITKMERKTILSFINSYIRKK